MKSLRLAGVLAAAAVLTAVSLPAAAAPTPYPPATGVPGAVASLDVTDDSPDAGGSETGNGDGFVPGESVSFDLHSTVIHLGNVVASSTGAVSLTFTVPAGFSGVHSLVITGLSSGRVASASFTVGGTVGANGLPLTGADIAALLVLAAALGGGGVVLTSVARRRRVPA